LRIDAAALEPRSNAIGHLLGAAAARDSRGIIRSWVASFCSRRPAATGQALPADFPSLVGFRGVPDPNHDNPVAAAENEIL
jgi:hypothetical protein